MFSRFYAVIPPVLFHVSQLSCSQAKVFGSLHCGVREVWRIVVTEPADGAPGWGRVAFSVAVAAVRHAEET